MSTIRLTLLLLAKPTDSCVPATEPIELINVAFEQPRVQSKRGEPTSHEKKASFDVPDRLSGLEALAELGKVCGVRQWRFVEVNISYSVGNFRLKGSLLML